MIEVFLKKKRKSQVNYLTSYLKELEKKKKKTEVSRWKELVKIREKTDFYKIEKEIIKPRACSLKG